MFGKAVTPLTWRTRRNGFPVQISHCPALLLLAVVMLTCSGEWRGKCLPITFHFLRSTARRDSRSCFYFTNSYLDRLSSLPWNPLSRHIFFGRSPCPRTSSAFSNERGRARHITTSRQLGSCAIRARGSRSEKSVEKMCLSSNLGSSNVFSKCQYKRLNP